MSMTSSPIFRVLGALALLTATAVCVGYFALSPKSSTSSAAGTEEDAPPGLEENEPKVGKQELIKVFMQITQQMERVILKISQLEQAILQRARGEGQELDSQELREQMMSEFASAMKEVEGRVYEHFKVSEGDVEAATMFYNDDADFRTVLKTLRRKYALFTGQGVEDVPDFITMELIMDVMSETMTKMTAAMEDVFNQTKLEFPVGTQQFLETLQQRYVERIGVLRQKVQTKYGIDQDLLQAGVIKYQNDPEFQKKMIELTNEQTLAYQKLGLA